jgi:hypothetical protein
MAKAAICYAKAAKGGDFRGAFNHARMLAGEGRLDEARHWLGRCAETATPAFVGKALAFLTASPWPELSDAMKVEPC